MSLAIVLSRANVGIEAPLVTVEAHLSNGLPGVTVVGLPETTVKESRERVRSAFLTARLDYPHERHVVVNLAPADLPKSGSRFDLAIAIGLLAATGQVRPESLEGHEFLGELALAGEIRPVPGVLPGLMAARREGRRAVVPQANAAEAGLLKDADAGLASHLLDVLAYLSGERELPRPKPSEPANDPPDMDLREVKGQHQARRALCIAAAGGHNLLFHGPPGTGKTMLAARMPTILPPLDDDQALEAASIRSISRGGFDSARWRQPPFRAPHHTSSAVALVGGGGNLHVGEISLAHNGVLFLDELPEFSPHVLEVLREPLESGQIMIARARYQVRLPARFQLLAAMNPCPCGFHGDPKGECRCTEEKVRAYRQRISGPLLDRIDMHVEVPRLNEAERKSLLGGENPPETCSAAIRAKVARCRERQLARAGKLNAHLTPDEISRYCMLAKEDAAMLEEAVERLRLSIRAHHRILKIARTIADLEEAGAIARSHLLEAIGYRKLDKQ